MPKISSYAPTNPTADVHATSTTQEADLGAKVVTNDGRAYRYAKAGGTALAVGKLMDSPGNTTTNSTRLVATAASAGDTTIEIAMGGAVTANQFAGGQICVQDDAGEGYTYTIKSHPAIAGAADLVFTLEDGETVQVALTTATTVGVFPNQYNGLIIHPVSELSAPLGVTPTAVGADEYFWLQTRGPAVVLSDATIAARGLPVAASTTTAGSVTLGTGALAPIGTALIAGVSTEYQPVFLQLD